MKYTLTKFEIAMMQMFHQLYGSDTRPIQEQPIWKDIQDLKKAAWGELTECPITSQPSRTATADSVTDEKHNFIQIDD